MRYFITGNTNKFLHATSDERAYWNELLTAVKRKPVVKAILHEYETCARLTNNGRAKPIELQFETIQELDALFNGNNFPYYVYLNCPGCLAIGHDLDMITIGAEVMAERNAVDAYDKGIPYAGPSTVDVIEANQNEMPPVEGYFKRKKRDEEDRKKREQALKSESKKQAERITKAANEQKDSPKQMMLLTHGQMDEVTRMALASDRGAVSSIAYTLGVDQQRVELTVLELERQLPGLIMTRQEHTLGDRTMLVVYIPNELKARAQRFLEKGGWANYYDHKEERLKAERTAELDRKKLEEDSWVATREQATIAQVAARDADKRAKRANWIAWLAFLAAILSIVLSWLKSSDR